MLPRAVLSKNGMSVDKRHKGLDLKCQQDKTSGAEHSASEGSGQLYEIRAVLSCSTKAMQTRFARPLPSRTRQIQLHDWHHATDCQKTRTSPKTNTIVCLFERKCGCSPCFLDVGKALHVTLVDCASVSSPWSSHQRRRHENQWQIGSKNEQAYGELKLGSQLLCVGLGCNRGRTKDYVAYPLYPTQPERLPNPRRAVSKAHTANVHAIFGVP